MAERLTYPRQSIVVLVCPSDERRNEALEKWVTDKVVVDETHALWQLHTLSGVWPDRQQRNQAMKMMLSWRLQDGGPLLYATDTWNRQQAKWLQRQADKYQYQLQVVLLDPSPKARDIQMGYARWARLTKEISQQPNTCHISNLRYRQISSINWVEHPGTQFDIVGDVHGCLEELELLLAELEYSPVPSWHHPQGRQLLFVGDLVNRGPDTLGVLRLVAELVAAGVAHIAAIGNHDVRLLHSVTDYHQHRFPSLVQELWQQDDMVAAIEEIATLTIQLFAQAPVYSVYDNGKLVVVHAALRPFQVGSWHHPSHDDSSLSHFGMYGEITHERVSGFRYGQHQVGMRRYGVQGYEWTRHWPAEQTVVHGHDVVGIEPWQHGENNNIWSIDTGCVFGGTLTALRYPEMTTVSVPCQHPPHAPFVPNPRVQLERYGSTDVVFGGRKPTAWQHPMALPADDVLYELPDDTQLELEWMGDGFDVYVDDLVNTGDDNIWEELDMNEPGVAARELG